MAVLWVNGRVLMLLCTAIQTGLSMGMRKVVFEILKESQTQEILLIKLWKVRNLTTFTHFSLLIMGLF